ncbi:hypothetical protein [Desulfosporosinus metallidurans]|uniref:Uncharacterized protein n=1 Tax=Desulfosporosinus metallidurans TaxID=1888891 RepID=A0A1Q8QPD0_9FIRM|nr:hypothetical protein [Desulfosporosinus metallidurans]OLN29176.1 hypothetical protein DSOL_3679 [Desulfosporosinus metallidurans]
MEQDSYQTQLELYKTLVNETLLRLGRIEYFIGSLDYAANIGSGKMLDGLDLRDIAETLGL